MESYKKRLIISELRSRNNKRIAVLGSGIVAHLASRLLKDVVVFTKKRTNIFLNNIFFHDTIENRLMLKMFDIDFVSKEVPVYYYNNQTNEYTSTLTSTISQCIANEKMGKANGPAIISNMVDSKSKFINLFFDENRLRDELLNYTECVELFPDYIVEQSDGVLLFFGDQCVEVDYLINTIPQPFFVPLLYRDDNSSLPNYEYRPLVFVTHNVDCSISDKMTYSYNDCFWKRIFVKSGVECIEFEKNSWNEDRFKKYFPFVTDYKATEINYGRISSVEVPDTKRIKHIGRFAQWQHSITTEHSINKLINLNL